MAEWVEIEDYANLDPVTPVLSAEDQIMPMLGKRRIRLRLMRAALNRKRRLLASRDGRGRCPSPAGLLNQWRDLPMTPEVFGQRRSRGGGSEAGRARSDRDMLAANQSGDMR